jgi:hypothetical protein
VAIGWDFEFPKVFGTSSQCVDIKFSMCSHDVPNPLSTCFSSLKHVPQDVPNSIINAL